MSRPFSVQVGSAGSAVVITVIGDLDMFTADRLEPALAAIPPGTHTWIDLTDCDYVDSAGLHVLRTYTREIGPDRVTLVAPATSPVRRVLDLTGLAGYFRVVTERPG